MTNIINININQNQNENQPILSQARLFISQNPDSRLFIKNTDTKLFLFIQSQSNSQTLVTIDNPTLEDEAKLYFLKKKIEGEIHG